MRAWAMVFGYGYQKDLESGQMFGARSFDMLLHQLLHESSWEGAPKSDASSLFHPFSGFLILGDAVDGLPRCSGGTG